MSAQRLIVSWDTMLACLVLVLGVIFLDEVEILPSAMKDILTISITSLSILFSVFFAGVAVVITSGDDHFASWLEEENDGFFSELISGFTWAMGCLFVDLVLSILFYICVALNVGMGGISYVLVGVYLAITSYSFFVAFSMALAVMQYAKRRSVFFLLKNSSSLSSSTSGSIKKANGAKTSPDLPPGGINQKN